ncbi:MAG: hypothetical protein HXY25_09660, partial [Alphaproteobacteria bacterium]|nr:hypothetical protein [Alphaproteobacteria bacterium]
MADAATGGPLVSAAWLAGRLGAGTLRIVDGSWYLPAMGRNARGEFEAGHIPGAVFFDLEEVSDRTNPLPHMLPTARHFETAVGELGIAETDEVVIYDGAGIFSAPRIWWTFHVMGHERAYVLDGGLPAWRAAGG